MIPTWRLYLALLVLAALSGFGGAATGFAVLAGALVVVVAAVDALLARDLAAIVLTRELDDKQSLGAWNPVRISVAGRASRAMRLDLRDVPPPTFELQPGPEPARRAPRTAPTVMGRALRGLVAAAPAPPTFSLSLAAPTDDGAATGAVSYRVRPVHRGDYQFGDIHLRAAGPLGLMTRQRRIAGSARAVRVYPNLREVRKYELLARRGMAGEAGAHAQRVPGAGTEFERLREYAPGDEFRRVNWKATARRGRPIVNQYETERSQNLVIVLDTGRLMGARADLPPADAPDALAAGDVPPGLTKLDHALNSALLLAYVGTLRGDRVALLAYDDRVRVYLPPARGRRAFVRIVEAFYALEPTAVEPDHGLAFQFLSGRNLRRSLVALFTDLADRESSAALVARISQAGRHHQVLCVTLADPTISRPAAAQPASAQQLYEKMVAQRLLDERAQVLALLSQRGVLTLDTDADHLSPHLIAAYLALKQRARV